MARTNLHIFLSAVRNESRLEKETKSVIEQGCADNIVIAGLWEDGLQKRERIDENREVIRVTTSIRKMRSKGMLTGNSLLRKFLAAFGFFEYFMKTLWISIRKKPKIISCHNLILLPLAVVIKFVTRAKLVYTPHELETERTGLKGRAKKISKFIERRFINAADRVIVVCEPIMKWYQEAYGLTKVYTVQNIPENPYYGSTFEKTNLIRKEYGIPEDAIIYIYQGVLGVERGIKSLLMAFSKVSNSTKAHLVLMGYGEMESEIRDYASKYDCIHFKSAVPVNEIINYTSSCDIGLFFIDSELSLSYKYSMPNKFFEYLIGGLPVVVSANLEYLSGLITTNGIGKVVDNSQKDLVSLVESISKEELSAMRQTVQAYAKNVGWQNNATTIKEAYLFN